MNALPRRAPYAGRLLRGLLAVAILLAPVVEAQPAAAATPSPSPSASPTSQLPVRVTVTDVAPQMIRPTDTLVVRATVRNTGDRELVDPRVTLRIQRVLISTRGALTQWANAGPRASAGTAVQPPVALGGPLAPGAQADVELQVPASTLALAKGAAGWGPRGIAVEVTDAGVRRGLDRTFAVWLPTDQVSPVKVSVAVPLTSDAVDPKVSPTPATSAKEIARLGDLLKITQDHPEVAWAVDPAMLAALAAEAAPRDAGTNVRVLTIGLAAAATGRDIFTLPSLDPDLAALAHAGASDLAAVAAKLAASAPLPVLGTPPRTDLAWPTDPVPDQATVTLAAQLGAKAIIVGDAGLAPVYLNHTVTGRATVPTTAGNVAALVADPTMTNLLTHPGPSASAATQRLLAETAVVARERPDDPSAVLLAPGRDWRPDVTVARTELAALTAAPWVTLSSLPTLMGTADPGVDREPLPARAASDREIPGAEIATLRAARAKLAVFATLVPNPGALVAGTDAVALAPLSGAWRADPHARTAAVQDAVSKLAERGTGVSIVSGSALNVISKSGTFPVGLRNDLDQDATVKVALAPNNRLLVVAGPQTVTVPAKSEIQARIPFHAVGSGDAQVEVRLLAPDGTVIYGPTPSAVRVRADWENVGTGVIAGLLGLAFLIGIARTIRRGQTAKRGASLDQIAEIAGPAGGPVIPETPTRTAADRHVNLGRHTTVMAVGTAVSRFLGVVRVALLVYAIGVTTNSANAFAVGNKLPNMLFMLIGGGVLQAVLVPQVVRAYKRPGGDGDDYVNRLLTLGTVLLAGMTAILTIGAPVLVALYTDNERLAGLTVLFAYWCLPQVLFYGLYTLIGQVLNARGSYGPLMWAPAINNLVAMAGLGTYLAVFGNGHQNRAALQNPGSWTGGQIALLAGTATLGVVAQALVLLVPLYRGGFRYRPRWGFRGVGLGQAGRVASWTFASLAVGMAAMLVVTRIASAVGESGGGAGLAGNAVYDNAFLIFMLPHSLITLSLLTALFTGLSAKAAIGDVPAVRADLSFGLRGVGLFTIVAAAILMVLALPLVHVVFLSASAQDASAMAPVIAVMMLGLPAYGAWSMAQRVFYAYADAKAMFPIQVAMAAIVVAGAVATQLLTAPRYWVAGASLAMTVSYGVGAVVSLWMLRRRIGGFGARHVVWMHVRASLAAGIAGGAGWAAVHRIGGLVNTGWERNALICVGVGLLMSAVYVGVLKLMRVGELDDLLRPVLGRVRRSA